MILPRKEESEASKTRNRVQRKTVPRFLAEAFIVIVQKFYPDPFVFLIVLTLVTFAGALAVTDTGVFAAVTAWGDGMPSLMAFTAQISITLVVAHALATTGPVRSLLFAAARVPQRTWQAYCMVACLSGIASLIAWPLGLVAGATLAKHVAAEAEDRGLDLDYPLLVASAYSGFVVWHMGYSGTAPLFVATEGHSLQSSIGIIPVSETILSPWNLILALITLVVVSITCVMMRPPAHRVRKIERSLLTLDAEKKLEKPARSLSVGERISHSRFGSLVFGGLLIAYLILWFSERGFSLDLNIVNWSLLAAGLVLVRSPAHYVSLVLDGGRSLGAVLLQYPFYAAIMGLMSSSGLVALMSSWFVSVSSETTLPLWAFLSGGIVNFFIPSGGGQWAVQGPIFIEAAQALNVDPALMVMAVAYGDQWTNMIQPFWTIPLLAVAGLSIRDVMGYTFVTLIVTGLLFTGGLAVTTKWLT